MGDLLMTFTLFPAPMASPERRGLRE